ncbi:MAG: hypothetical protein EKK52_16520 [Burkholderiales bacterium]|nr:MAG: hypothetical protein EKK52_16520 [Burkholderiales bacterium]
MSNPAAFARAPVSVTAWWWRLARWMLVALLVVDQVSAPLHAHHHEGGVDATWVSASSHHIEANAHADVNDDGPAGHWALAVRSASGAGSVDATGESNDLPQAERACLNTKIASAIPKDVVAGSAYASWRLPPIPSYRSMPPDAHAPPVVG